MRHSIDLIGPDVSVNGRDLQFDSLTNALPLRFGNDKQHNIVIFFDRSC